MDDHYKSSISGLIYIGTGLTVTIIAGLNASNIHTYCVGGDESVYSTVQNTNYTMMVLGVIMFLFGIAVYINANNFYQTVNMTLVGMFFGMALLILGFILNLNKEKIQCGPSDQNVIDSYKNMATIIWVGGLVGFLLSMLTFMYYHGYLGKLLSKKAESEYQPFRKPYAPSEPVEMGAPKKLNPNPIPPQ